MPLQNAFEGLAVESKQDTLNARAALLATEAKLEEVRALLATLTTEDFATQATLEQVRVLLEDSTRFANMASEATLAAARALLADILAASDSDFKRLLKFEPRPGEEIRREPGPSFDYHGAAPDGSLDTAPVWKVVRFDKSVPGIQKVRYRTGVAWADRAEGWS